MALVIPSIAAAQTPPAVSGFVSGNFGMAMPVSDTLTSSAAVIDGVDRAEARLTTPMKSSPLLDIGGGILVHNRWMFGASFDRTSQSQAAEVGFTFDHPEFHPPLHATATTEPLKVVDQGLHLSAGVNFPLTSKFSLRLFGGPSYLTREQDILSDISVDETMNPATRAFTASIVGYELRRVSSSAWGYHVGADGTYYFSRHVGVGGQLRYSRATFETENILQSQVDDRPATDLVKGGGLRLAAGVRLRF